jgi:hypothetical protein
MDKTADEILDLHTRAIKFPGMFKNVALGVEEDKYSSS